MRSSNMHISYLVESAPWSRRVTSNSWWPCWAARWRGVLPWLSIQSISAPAMCTKDQNNVLFISSLLYACRFKQMPSEPVDWKTSRLTLFMSESAAQRLVLQRWFPYPFWLCCRMRIGKVQHASAQFETRNYTTPTCIVSLLVYKPMGAEHAADRTIAQQWCNNKFALRIIWISAESAILSRTKIILWMKYVLCIDARWIYLARR